MRSRRILRVLSGLLGVLEQKLLFFLFCIGERVLFYFILFYFLLIFVVFLTAAINWPIYHLILVPTNSELIYYIVFIIVIAASVQLVEMIMVRFFPALQASFGIFLPLITVNCTVLFISLKATTVDNLSYIQTVVYSISAAIGFWLAMIMVAAIYEKLDLIGKVPKGLQGPGIIMIITGIIALAFMGFSGMV